MPPRQAPRWRHVRSEGLATSSWCGLVVPPLSRIRLTLTHRTQPQHSHSRFRVGYDAHRVVPGWHRACHPEHTEHQEGCSRHAEFASCASSFTGGTGQAGGQTDVEPIAHCCIAFRVFYVYYICIIMDKIKGAEIESNGKADRKANNGTSARGQEGFSKQML